MAILDDSVDMHGIRQSIAGNQRPHVIESITGTNKIHNEFYFPFQKPQSFEYNINTLFPDMLTDKQQCKLIILHTKTVSGSEFIFSRISSNNRSEIISVFDYCQRSLESVFSDCFLNLSLWNPYFIARIEEIQNTLHYYRDTPRCLPKRVFKIGTIL